MRALLSSIILLIVASCAPAGNDEKVERLEIRRSGWFSIDIVIDAEGNGIYKKSEPFPRGIKRHFKLTRGELSALLKQLQPYRKQAVPFSEDSARRLLERTCPKGVPQISDAGAFYARWLTANHDVHYLADFECDYKRLADRNRELLEILEGLSTRSGR